MSKEEEEGITAEADEVCEDEVFQCTLASRLWTDNPSNTRASLLSAWKEY